MMSSMKTIAKAIMLSRNHLHRTSCEKEAKVSSKSKLTTNKLLSIKPYWTPKAIKGQMPRQARSVAAGTASKASWKLSASAAEMASGGTTL